MQAITPESADRGPPGNSDRGILRARWLSHGCCLRHPTSASSATAKMASALTKLGLTTEDLSHRRVTAVLTFLRDSGLRGG
jgi:hypothetical protein